MIINLHLSFPSLHLSHLFSMLETVIVFVDETQAFAACASRNTEKWIVLQEWVEKD